MQRGYWIRSKPLYDSLVWQTPAVAHLVVAGGEGGIAVLKLFQQMYPKDPIQVLYADLPTAEKNYSDILQQIVQLVNLLIFVIQKKACWKIWNND